jgi:OOP family OmpA-OmpF porin
MRFNLLLGILAFFLLCLSCLSRHFYRIQDDLRSRSSEALAGAGISVANLSFSGRDATLAGPIVSDELRSRAADIVSRVYGVRKVVNQLAVTGSTPVMAGPAELQQNLDRLIAGKIIHFASGSDVIVEDGRALLDQLVPILAKNTSQAIEIGGHTDGIGDPSANQDLSWRRADAVKTYLISRGVNSSLLTAVGYGSSTPVADDGSAAGRQANRRIVFRVKEGK